MRYFINENKFKTKLKTINILGYWDGRLKNLCYLFTGEIDNRGKEEKREGLETSMRN